MHGIDDRNGQEFFAVLLGVTLLIGVVAIAGDFQRSVQLGCVLGAGVVGTAPEWIFGRLRTPSRLAPADVHPIEDVTTIPSADVYRLSYSWSFTPSLDHTGNPAHYSVRLDIPKAVFRHFSEREHPLPTAESDLAAVLPQYVSGGLTDEVMLCAGRVATEGRRQDLPFLDFIDFMLAFVRDSIEYKSDQELHGQAEYFAYPIETLVHKKGDCDCHAILAAALLTAH